MNKCKLFKLVGIGFCASFIGTSVFVSNFVQPIYLPLSVYLKQYEGFWIFLQGVGIPISLFIAIYLPTIQRKREDLEKLIAHRNIAYFVERYARIHIADTVKPGFNVKEHNTGYIACVKELDGLDRSQIRPAVLIEKLVDLVCFAKRFSELINKDTYVFYDKEECDLCVARMKKDMDQIDAYLEQRGVSFDFDRIAYV